MGLETGTHISDLNPDNPVTQEDIVREGSDHLRLIKSTILNTFPNISGEMVLTHLQLNQAALKDAPNVFTETQTVQSIEPTLLLNETDAPVDQKKHQLKAVGGALLLEALSDADIATTLIEMMAGVVILNYQGDPRLQTAEGGIIGSGGLSGFFDIDGLVMGVSLSVNGTVRAQTELDGWSVRGASNNEVAYYLDNVNGTNRGSLGYAASDTLKLSNAVGTIQLEQQGAIKAATLSAGLEVWGDSAGGLGESVNAVIQLKTTAGALRGIIGFQNTADLQLDNRNTSGRVTFSGRDSSNASLTLARFDPDGSSDIWHGGVLSFETQDHTAAAATSSARVKDHAGSLRDVGFNNQRLVVTDSNVSLAAEHAGNYIYYGDGLNYTITLPGAGSLDFPAGARVEVLNRTGGTITLSAASGASIYYFQGVGQANPYASAEIAPGGWVTIHRFNAGGWFVTGSGLSV